MQHQAPQHIIRKRPLRTNTHKLALVRRVTLDPQANGEYELTDCDAEAGEEGVVGLRYTMSAEYLAWDGGMGVCMCGRT